MAAEAPSALLGLALRARKLLVQIDEVAERISDYLSVTTGMSVVVPFPHQPDKDGDGSVLGEGLGVAYLSMPYLSDINVNIQDVRLEGGNIHAPFSPS